MVRGEPGIGKTALLEQLLDSASGFRVVRALGVEGEIDLPYAGLHQLCRSMIDTIDVLPEPQAQALRIAFGLESGQSPDRYLIGLAVLTLMSEAGTAQPLLCLLDDAQWLDRQTTHALAFVARRLGADSVGLVFSSREAVSDLDGLQELQMAGLSPGDASALLDTVLVGGRMDADVRERLLAETNGNPLALVELPRALTPVEAYGGLRATQGSVPSRVEQSFRQRLELLPDDTQTLMLVAAAEPVGDPILLRRAATSLGLPPEAADAAEEAGLFEIRERCTFRHPLVRSAAYRSATPSDRRMVHAALADVTDERLDPDRKVWHRAHATVEPDEGVAAALERSAARAAARGGLAAAGAFLERAAFLTPDETQRASRMLAAAESMFEAGAFAAAQDLVKSVEVTYLDELGAACALRLQGRILRGLDQHSHGGALALLSAAERLMKLDPVLARLTQFELSQIVYFLGDDELFTRSMNLLSEPSVGDANSPIELIARGLATASTANYLDSSALRHQAAVALCAKPRLEESDIPCVEATEGGTLSLWDFDTWEVMTRRAVEFARERESPMYLCPALARWTEVTCVAGAFSAARSADAEARGIAEAMGGLAAPLDNYSAALAVWLRPEPEALERLASFESLHSHPDWDYGRAVLHNAAGRYEHALAAAQRSCDLHPTRSYSRALPELIEAAVRCGDAQRAELTLKLVAERAHVVCADWGLGLLARCSALLSVDPSVAEELFRESLLRLSAARTHPDLARAHLLYGEWLRRENRRIDSREQLRAADNLLSGMGTELFVDRVHRELAATGETARKRTNPTRADLTTQETQIAQLASEGMRNSEIAAKLFLSPRTIEWHLRRIYPKLGIQSRRELRQVLG